MIDLSAFETDLGTYILGADGEPQRVDEVEVWGAWMQAHREVDHVVRVFGAPAAPDAIVSTKFMGIDLRLLPRRGVGRPLLWETYVIGGPLGREMWRYGTRAEAREGHARMCAAVEAALGEGRN